MAGHNKMLAKRRQRGRIKRQLSRAARSAKKQRNQATGKTK